MGNSQSYSHSSNSGNKNSSDNSGDNNVWKEHREFKQVIYHNLNVCLYANLEIKDANTKIQVDVDSDTPWKMHRNIKKS